jgi:hypothetical protein
MRTKTILLSALLGAIGSVSVMAQTNVYSLNAVGYINVTCPVGFSIVSCPLTTSPDNTLNTVMNNGAGGYNGSLNGCEVYFWQPSTAGFSTDAAEAVGTGSKGTTANTNGWTHNGTNVLSPGAACWFQNNTLNPLTLTFVGQVPSTVTNTLGAGFSLVGAGIPMSGDLASNTLANLTNYNIGDQVYVWVPASNGFNTYSSASGKAAGFGYQGQWTSTGDPIVTNVGEGFWYENNSSPVTSVVWTESYSVSQ